MSISSYTDQTAVGAQILQHDQQLAELAAKYRAGQTLRKSLFGPLFGASGGLQTTQSFQLTIGAESVDFSAAQAVSHGALTAGENYKIFAHSDGTLTAQQYDLGAPANAAELGGFHAAASDASIVELSIWDLHTRPKSDPRAMVYSSLLDVWADIYLMHTTYGLDKYSKLGTQIADGASLPVLPLERGGNGSTTYPSMSRFNAAELAAVAGKRLMTNSEFEVLAWGVVEQQSRGTDPVTTKHDAAYRSAIGCEQITGCMWQWGEDRQANTGGGWAAITEGRGSIYHSGANAVLLGADWDGGANAGSRCAYWSNAPSDSSSYIGARAVSDALHLM